MKRILAIAMLVGVAFSGSVAAAEPGVGTRIVGTPTDAVQAEWPFMTVVSPNGGLCGGSVITPRWILSAAHCTFDDFGNPISRFTVYPGAWDLDALPTGVAPDAVRVNPAYRPDASDWDFVLLRAPGAMSPVPVALPSPDDDDDIAAAVVSSPSGARNGRIAGWGSTGVAGGGPFPRRLQTISSGIPVLTDGNCSGYAGFSPASMVCAGGFPTSGTADDTCKGDSGGPLAVDVGPRRIIVGLTSFGSLPCGNPSLPGVYSKVSAARDWICDTVTSPTSITATAGATTADVAWTPDTTTCAWRNPTVVVTASPGGASATATLSSGGVRLSGLSPGTTYTISAQISSSAGATPPAATTSVAIPAPAPTPAPAPAVAACSKTFYQQAARTSRTQKAPNGTNAVRVVSRLRIYEDAESWCRVNLTFIFRNKRTGARLSQLPGSTLGFRKLTGKDFSAPVVGWPTEREFRFVGSDTTGLNRRDARLVLVSYLRKTSSMPSQSNIELLVVRRVPTNAAQGSSAANPLFAQKNAFGTAVGWATVS